jgi:hypothetical protein
VVQVGDLSVTAVAGTGKCAVCVIAVDGRILVVLPSQRPLCNRCAAVVYDKLESVL